MTDGTARGEAEFTQTIPKYRANESRANRRQAESDSQACLNIAEARRRKTKSSSLGYAECSRYST